jgi:PAS domain S-box-containing protein
MKDRDGRHLLVNAFYEEATGVLRDTIIGKTDFEVLPHEVAARIVAQDRSVMESGKSSTFEETVPGPDGAARHYLTTKVPLIDADGVVYGMCGIATDITELKEAERRIRETEQFYRSVLESAPDGMMVVSADGSIELVNSRIAELFGYTRAELLGQPVEMLVPDELRGRRESWVNRPSRTAATTCKRNGSNDWSRRTPRRRNRRPSVTRAPSTDATSTTSRPMPTSGPRTVAPSGCTRSERSCAMKAIGFASCTGFIRTSPSASPTKPRCARRPSAPRPPRRPKARSWRR